MTINQAIFSYPDGSGAIATCPHHYKLVAFAQQFALRTGAKVETIVRRHDICGPSCKRLSFQKCVQCETEAILREPMQSDPVTKTSPLIPIPSPLDVGKVATYPTTPPQTPHS